MSEVKKTVKRCIISTVTRRVRATTDDNDWSAYSHVLFSRIDHAYT